MIAGGIGTILTAGYFLWMLQRVNLGTMPDRWKDHAFSDVLTVEWVAWIAAADLDRGARARTRG